jgi:hypothetical protein
MGVPEVIKGYFDFSLADHVFTVAAKGVTKVRFPKQGTWGEHVTLDLTGMSWTLNDDGHASEQFIGLFETTASVAWGNALPFQTCLVNKDNVAANVRMALTLDPVAARNKVTGTANYIGDNATAPVTSDQRNWIICDNITPGDWVDLPSVWIGHITATKDASAGGVWDIAALSSTNGYGKSSRSVKCTMPVAQRGATTTHFVASGGTVPVYATNYYYFWLDDDGICKIVFAFDGDGGAEGNGANGLRISLPFTSPDISTLGSYYPGDGYSAWKSKNNATYVGGNFSFYGAGNIVGFDKLDASTLLTETEQNNATRSLRGGLSFRAF